CFSVSCFNLGIVLKTTLAKKRKLDMRQSQSAGGGVYVAEEKNSGAELAPAEEFFIPLKFFGREPLGEQENLQSVKSDPSLFTEASALPMR
ncbi:MAG: hypothetical protein IJU12_10780, partial [Clostridia bacterium]|nr:hypothetical protein [Clostridia bacterium]